MPENYQRELELMRDRLAQMEEVAEELRETRDASTGRRREGAHWRLKNVERRLTLARDALFDVESIENHLFKTAVGETIAELPETPERD